RAGVAESECCLRLRRARPRPERRRRRHRGNHPADARRDRRAAPDAAPERRGARRRAVDPVRRRAGPAARRADAAARPRNPRRHRSMGMSLDAAQLFALLPAAYRTRDAENGGALEALFAVMASQSAIVEDNIEQLYDDQFIETCAPWVIPYIGDLLGYNAIY